MSTKPKPIGYLSPRDPNQQPLVKKAIRKLQNLLPDYRVIALESHGAGTGEDSGGDFSGADRCPPCGYVIILPDRTRIDVYRWPAGGKKHGHRFSSEYWTAVVVPGGELVGAFGSFDSLARGVIEWAGATEHPGRAKK